MLYPKAIGNLFILLIAGLLFGGCAGNLGGKPAGRTDLRADYDRESRYASRVMTLAETRGVSVLWFNAPLEEAPVNKSTTCDASAQR
jgi:hypothetical protein